MLLLDPKPLRRTQTQSTPSKKSIAPTSGSDTEESESDLLLEKQSTKGKGAALPIPARSVSPAIDPGRAPGRIIGSTYPLQDFEKNISQGDVISKAVEDLGFVIKDIVMKPFSSRRTDELLECMRVFRDVSLKVCTHHYIESF